MISIQKEEEEKTNKQNLENKCLLWNTNILELESKYFFFSVGWEAFCHAMPRRKKEIYIYLFLIKRNSFTNYFSCFAAEREIKSNQYIYM